MKHGRPRRLRLDAGDTPPRSKLVEKLFVHGVVNVAKKVSVNHGEELRAMVREVHEDVRDERSAVLALKQRLEEANAALSDQEKADVVSTKARVRQLESWYVQEIERREKEVALLRRKRPAPKRRVKSVRRADLDELSKKVKAMTEANSRTEKRDKSNEHRLGDCIKHNASKIHELQVLLKLTS